MKLTPTQQAVYDRMTTTPKTAYELQASLSTLRALETKGLVKSKAMSRLITLWKRIMPGTHLINKIHLGDCLELMRDIPDGSVDMVLCDLPYGTTACKWDTIIPFEPLWEQYWRVCKPNAAVVLMASQPFTTKLISSQIKHYKATWYWRKERGTNFVQAKRYPMRVIEDCCVFCKGTPLYNPAMREVKPYSHVLPKPKKGSSQHMDSSSVDENGERIIKKYSQAYPVNILEIPRDNMTKGKSLHPHPKACGTF